MKATSIANATGRFKCILDSKKSYPKKPIATAKIRAVSGRPENPRGLGDWSNILPSVELYSFFGELGK